MRLFSVTLGWLARTAPCRRRAWQRRAPAAQVLCDTHKGHEARVRACHAQGGIRGERDTRDVRRCTRDVRPMYAVMYAGSFDRFHLLQCRSQRQL